MKLLAAIAIWTGTASLGAFLFLVAIIGGVLAVLTLITGHFNEVSLVSKISWRGANNRKQTNLPNSAAIGIAAHITSYQGAGFVISIKSLF